MVLCRRAGREVFSVLRTPASVWRQQVSLMPARNPLSRQSASIHEVKEYVTEQAEKPLACRREDCWWVQATSILVASERSLSRQTVSIHDAKEGSSVRQAESV